MSLQSLPHAFFDNGNIGHIGRIRSIKAHAELAFQPDDEFDMFE
jgi:hypothetical protein